MKIWITRKGLKLIPADRYSEEQMSKIPEGKEVTCHITQKRSSKHHRKYWAILQVVFDNLPEVMQHDFKSVGELHIEMKLQTGLRRKYTTLGGTEIWIPDSIAFDKMDQIAFAEFFDKALDVIVKYILIGTDKEELLNQIV